jgi:hypothetical protein
MIFGRDIKKMKKKKVDKDGWSNNPITLIKQLGKATRTYLKAGGKITPKMKRIDKKIDKIFADMSKRMGLK